VPQFDENREADRVPGAVDLSARPTVHRRHWYRIGVVAGVVVVVGFIGFVALRYTFREHPGPRSLNSAMNAFKGEASTTLGVSPGYQFPAAGVYELRGQGSERISFPPNSQDDGKVMPASVNYLANNCWRWHVDYNVAHWEEYDFCPRGRQLVLIANRNSQTWDFGTLKFTNLARFTCPLTSTVLPERPDPNETLHWSCTGSNTAVAGHSVTTTLTRIVAIETLRIGSVVVPTVHQHQRATVSGAQRGSVVEDWWFETASGLPVRIERRITISSSSPIGTVTYNEAGSWQMVSPKPRTSTGHGK
jgi:hypothetical protein